MPNSPGPNILPQLGPILVVVGIIAAPVLLGLVCWLTRKRAVSFWQGVLGSVVASVLGLVLPLVIGLVAFAVAYDALDREGLLAIIGFVGIQSALAIGGAVASAIWSWYVAAERGWFNRGRIAGVRGGLAVGAIGTAFLLIAGTSSL